MLPATVGLVYWKMITYCVPNDKSAQWHVALLSSPDPSLIVSVVSFLPPGLALICWNDSSHIRGTNRMPSACLSLSSLYPNCSLQIPLHPPPPPLNGEINRASGQGGGCRCSLRSGLCVCRLYVWHHCRQKSLAHVPKRLATTYSFYVLMLSCRWDVYHTAKHHKLMSSDTAVFFYFWQIRNYKFGILSQSQVCYS